MTQLKTGSLTFVAFLSVLQGQDVVNFLLQSCLPPADMCSCYNTTIDMRRGFLHTKVSTQNSTEILTEWRLEECITQRSKKWLVLGSSDSSCVKTHLACNTFLGQKCFCLTKYRRLSINKSRHKCKTLNVYSSGSSLFKLLFKMLFYLNSPIWKQKSHCVTRVLLFWTICFWFLFIWNVSFPV